MASPLKLLQPVRTPRNFLVVPIHYSHDPEKDEAWRDNERDKYRRESEDWQRDWDREMEMDFTSVSGTAAYRSYSLANLMPGMEYRPELPICLCMDFNIEPMIWEIAQVYKNLACFIDEIRLSPASIDDMVREFRNRYPAHQGELRIYGDATGNGRSPQTGKSDYDLVRLSFRGYSATLSWRVPASNPLQKDRMNAFNLKMKGTDGLVGVLIDPLKCPELVKDLKEVVTKDGQIVKIKKRDDPYFFRTHASDSGGYFIAREWPVIYEVLRTSPTNRRGPRKYTRIYGGLR
jgi:hypothetical protein